MCVYVCVCVCTYIYIYIEREREIWNFLHPPLSEGIRLRGQFWRRFFHNLVC